MLIKIFPIIFYNFFPPFRQHSIPCPKNDIVLIAVQSSGHFPASFAFQNHVPVKSYCIDLNERQPEAATFDEYARHCTTSHSSYNSISLTALATCGHALLCTSLTVRVLAAIIGLFSNNTLFNLLD